MEEYTQMRDVKDYPILATAIIEDIDIFITGDKDFIVLDVEIPEIMTMAEFLKNIN
jgi:predicted nucleic acid-binding protein